MEKTELIEVASKYFELSNNRELHKIQDLFFHDSIYSSDNTGIFYGCDEIMEMMKDFFLKFDFLNWKIDSIDVIKDSVVEIYFLLKMTDHNGDKFEKKGVERLVIVDNLIKYIEVRNI